MSGKLNDYIEKKHLYLGNIKCNLIFCIISVESHEVRFENQSPTDLVMYIFPFILLLLFMACKLGLGSFLMLYWQYVNKKTQVAISLSTTIILG